MIPAVPFFDLFQWPKQDLQSVDRQLSPAAAAISRLRRIHRIGIFVQVFSFSPAEKQKQSVSSLLASAISHDITPPHHISPFNVYCDSLGLPDQEQHRALLRDLSEDFGASIVETPFPSETIAVDAQAAVGAGAKLFLAPSSGRCKKNVPDVLVLVLEAPRQCGSLLRDLKRKGIKTAVLVSAELVDAVRQVVTAAAYSPDLRSALKKLPREWSAEKRGDVEAVLCGTWVGRWGDEVVTTATNSFPLKQQQQQQHQTMVAEPRGAALSATEQLQMLQSSSSSVLSGMSSTLGSSNLASPPSAHPQQQQQQQQQPAAMPLNPGSLACPSGSASLPGSAMPTPTTATASAAAASTAALLAALQQSNFATPNAQSNNSNGLTAQTSAASFQAATPSQNQTPVNSRNITNSSTPHGGGGGGGGGGVPAGQLSKSNSFTVSASANSPVPPLAPSPQQQQQQQQQLPFLPSGLVNPAANIAALTQTLALLQQQQAASTSSGVGLSSFIPLSSFPAAATGPSPFVPAWPAAQSVAVGRAGSATPPSAAHRSQQSPGESSAAQQQHRRSNSTASSTTDDGAFSGFSRANSNAQQPVAGGGSASSPMGIAAPVPIVPPPRKQ